MLFVAVEVAVSYGMKAMEWMPGEGVIGWAEEVTVCPEFTYPGFFSC